MHAGRLRDIVIVQRRTNPETDTWGEDNNLYAEAIRVSELSARFTIRYRTDIEASPQDYRILYFGRRWTFTSAIRDQKRSELVLESDQSTLLEVTTLQSTEREYIDGQTQIRPDAP